jgi:hypothetical protein
MRQDRTLEVTIQHTLAPGDVTLMRERSNPLRGDSLALAQWLRGRKFNLQSQQARLASQVRVAMASQDQQLTGQLIESLRAASIELKETEDALDQVLDLLHPGSERQSERRTKAAGILLAHLRLKAVQQFLLNSNVKSISERVRKANATFNPDDAAQAGKITLTLVHRAKS